MRRKRTKYGTLATLTFKRKLKTLENQGKRKIREKQLPTECQLYELQIYCLGELASAFCNFMAYFNDNRKFSLEIYQ